MNALRPGTARHVEVPNADHGMMGFASERAAFAGFGQPGAIYSETVAVALDDWLAPMSGPARSRRRTPACACCPTARGRAARWTWARAMPTATALDLFLAKEFAPNVLLRNDDGRYRLVEGALPAAPEDSEDAVLADFDGDGDLDAVFPSEDTANNEYLLNDGKGAFVASPHPAADRHAVERGAWPGISTATAISI